MNLSGETLGSKLLCAFLSLIFALFVMRYGETIGIFIRTARSWIHSRFRAATAPAGTDTLTRIILRDNIAGGPFKPTGGEVFKNTPAECAELAASIRSIAPRNLIDIALAAAWLFQEAKFSLLARNPNDDVATPGETLDQAFNHADVTVAQFDGATLRGWPEFAHSTTAEIEAKLTDLQFVLTKWAGMAAGHIAWAAQMYATYPEVKANLPPGTSSLALGILAYNHGRRGALDIASKPFNSAAWSYALKILAKRSQYQGELAS